MKYLTLFFRSRRSAAYTALLSRRLSGDSLSGAESTVGAYSRLVGLRSYSVDAVKLGNSDAVALAGAPDISQQAESGGSPAAFGPEMWVRQASDPGAGELLKQPDFVKMIQDIEKNPNTFNLYLKHRRSLNFQGRRDVEMAKFEECIKDCDKALERGREPRTDLMIVARAMTRKGTTLGKMAKCSKDHEPAIETFHKALTEHRNPDTLKKLNDAERAKKDLEQQEYFDPKLADEEREKGNQFFKEQKYPEAIKHYTEALKWNLKDPKACNNRAASYKTLGAMPEGLKDAEKCIELDPTFTESYTRKGAIQFFMKEFDKELETHQEGLKHDSSNQELLDDHRRCVDQINKGSRRDLSLDELKEKQEKAMQDPEIQYILTDPELIEFSEEEYERFEFLFLGLGLSSPWQLNNIKYEDCIKDCEKAVETERGREPRTDLKIVARALTRKGTALVKMAKCYKEFKHAIETFYKALTKHRNPDTLKKLNDAEKAKKDLEQHEYLDIKLADEEREKGNQFFMERKYPQAIKHYTEALKRNPKDPKAYSNRAASYTKLGAMLEGLMDTEKCIELVLTFAKGAIYFFMKDFDKTLETYQEGLKDDSSNQELLDGNTRCVKQINRASRGDLSPDELKERQAKAMQDPKIQNILTDPELIEVSEEKRKKKERKAMAHQKAMEAGNAAKKNAFGTGIRHYSKARNPRFRGVKKNVKKERPLIIYSDASWSESLKHWILSVVIEVDGDKKYGFIQAVKTSPNKNTTDAAFHAELKGVLNSTFLAQSTAIVRSQVQFYTDSLYLVRSVKGKSVPDTYKPYKPWVDYLKMLLQNLSLKYPRGARLSYIPRDRNSFADAFGKYVRGALEWKHRINKECAAQHLEFLSSGVYYGPDQMKQVYYRINEDKQKKEKKKEGK